MKHPVWLNASGFNKEKVYVGSTYTVDALSKNLDLTVEPGCEIAFDTQADGLTVAAQVVLVGEQAEEPTALSREGYVLDGWYTSAACKDSERYDFASDVNDDIKLFAKWVKVYNVSFADDITATATGTDIDSGDNVYETDKLVFTYIGTDIEHPVWLNIYGGTSVQLGTGNTLTVQPVTSELDVSVATGRAVTFDKQIEGVDAQVVITLDGTAVTAPTAPTKNGYKFEGWYTSAECKDDELYDFTSEVNSDITLYAKWAKAYSDTDFAVTFDDSSITAAVAGTDIGSGDTVTAGSKVVFTYTGTDIEHPIWLNTNGNVTEQLDTGNTCTVDAVDKALTISVAQGREITFDTQADGLKVDTQIILSGTSVTQPTAPTRAGYTFGGWYTSADCKDSDLYNFADAVNDDLTLYAKWTKLLDSDDTPSGDSGNTPSDDNGAESVGIDDESETGRESSATDADDTEDVKKTESENRNTDTKSPLTGEITGTSVWISMLLAVAVVIVIAHLYDRRWKVAQK